jgi:pSer/pThr/pTyr-binding forkhead associated (FHA) protein
VSARAERADLNDVRSRFPAGFYDRRRRGRPRLGGLDFVLFALGEPALYSPRAISVTWLGTVRARAQRSDLSGGRPQADSACGDVTASAVDDRGAPRASREAGMPKLTYVVGSGGETRSVDVGDSCSIGSLAGNTIVLDASLGVSRRHCQVLKIATGYELSDLGSTNGTKVNGQVVKRHKLAGGDVIEVGKVALTFDDGTAPAIEEEISIEESVSVSSGPAAGRTAGGASDQCMLVHAGGDKDGQKIPLDKQRTTFGRNAKNSVVLNDAGASGFHAEIAREGGAYVLRDLGSTNGTLVDGEPVSETALQHGARIRMGNVRYVFVDPTVSDFEKAMAAVDDLGSEWGMLRAEMDMTRVQQARRSQLLTTAVLLAVVLGGAALVYVNRDAITGGKPPLLAVADNRVADFSFEDRQGADWAPRPDSPTKARVATSKADGPAKQGETFYAVSRDGGGGACAAAQSSAKAPFTVAPGRAVEFGAQVRATGGALGGVRVSWNDRADATGREIGRSSSPLTASSTWTEVKGAAMPPEGARSARLELIDAAGGTAYFDDVFFVASGGSPGASAKDGAVTLSASDDAQTTISRGETRLLIDGAVIGGALRSDAIADPSRRGDRSGSQTLSRGGLAAEGKLVDPATGELQPFSVEIKSQQGRYVDVQVKSPPGADAAWTATLPDEFFVGGIGAHLEDDFRLLGEARIVDKVLDVSFGGIHRFKVSAGPKCGPLRMALSKVGDQWEVGFGATDGALSLRIDTDSEALIKDIDQLRSDATQARAQKKYGIAITKYRQLAGYYPPGKDRQDAEDAANELDAQGRARLDALVKRAEGAKLFHDDVDLVAEAAEGDALAASFDSHEIGAKAAEAATQCRAAYDANLKGRLERAAAPLLRKAADFEKLKMDALAKAFYAEVVARFPGTDAQKTAGEKLGK